MTWKEYDGFFANKPELEKLHKSISKYLENERSTDFHISYDEDLGDDFRKELLKLLEKIESKLSYTSYLPPYEPAIDTLNNYRVEV